MTEKCSGIYSPVLMLVEARGNPSARPSVSINVEQLCNPAVTSPQEDSTSGFYAEVTHVVSDVLSTVSGLCLKLKTSPTVVRIRSQLCAAVSLCGAPDLHFLTSFEQSTRTLSSQSPLAPGQRRLFSR